MCYQVCSSYIAVDLRNGQLIVEATTLEQVVSGLIEMSDTLGFDPFGEWVYIGEKGFEKNFLPKPMPKMSWIFYNNWSQEYISVLEDDLTSEMRWIIHGHGYELYKDGIPIEQIKQYMLLMEPDARPLKYQVRPVSLKIAQGFVNNYHRHHKGPQGHKFSLGLYDSAQTLLGVITVGRPVSRHLDNGETLEVTRCCVVDGFKNAISKLYGAVLNASKSMGYQKIITYTLTEESGNSMKAAGFQIEAVTKGGSWNSKKRKRIDKHPITNKYRWSKYLQ